MNKNEMNEIELPQGINVAFTDILLCVWLYLANRSVKRQFNVVFSHSLLSTLLYTL